jgi:hypothetical protein
VTETPTNTAVQRADWRSSIIGAIGMTILAGVFLIASAGLFDFSKPAVPVIWGTVIVVISILRLVAEPGSRVLALLSAGAGALTCITAIAVSDLPAERLSMGLLGLAAVIFSLIGLSARSEVVRA